MIPVRNRLEPTRRHDMQAGCDQYLSEGLHNDLAGCRCDKGGFMMQCLLTGIMMCHGPCHLHCYLSTTSLSC